MKTNEIEQNEGEEMVSDKEITEDNEFELTGRMPFEQVDMVYFSLISSFHPGKIEGDIDPRFLALWTLFLQCSGWTEDEYWEAMDAQDDFCPDCGASREDHDDEDALEALPAIEVKEEISKKSN